MKLPAFLLLLLHPCIYAQELRQTDYEKGYLKDGIKVGLWEYFNSKREKELAIDHSSGEVHFIRDDTARYTILKDGNWIKTKLDAVPLPMDGTFNFLDQLKRKILYPPQDTLEKTAGKVVASFEVDSLGNASNIKIIEGINARFDTAVIIGFLALEKKWLPARLGDKRFSSKLSFGVDFRYDKMTNSMKYEWVNENGEKKIKPIFVRLPVDSKFLSWIIISPERKDNPQKRKDNHHKRAEFPGGHKKLQEYVDKKFTYPWEAARIGMAGTLIIKFTVEEDGSITNVSIYPPIDPSFTKYQRKIALRVYEEITRATEKMPKWMPADENGKAVRSNSTIDFHLRIQRR